MNQEMEEDIVKGLTELSFLEMNGVNIDDKEIK